VTSTAPTAACILDRHDRGTGCEEPASSVQAPPTPPFDLSPSISTSQYLALPRATPLPPSTTSYGLASSGGSRDPRHLDLQDPPRLSRSSHLSPLRPWSQQPPPDPPIRPLARRETQNPFPPRSHGQPSARPTRALRRSSSSLVLRLPLGRLCRFLERGRGGGGNKWRERAEGRGTEGVEV
jgi:hypothetical protein